MEVELKWKKREKKNKNKNKINEGLGVAQINLAWLIEDVRVMISFNCIIALLC